MPAAALVVIVGAVCASIWFVGILRPTSAGAFAALAVWLTLPHVAMVAAAAWLRRRELGAGPWHIMSIAVSVGGLLLLADTVFWHPDAQGALGVLLVPVLQVGAMTVFLPVAAWLEAKGRGKNAD